MSTTLPVETAGAVVYPESDGKPMADNTRQFRWIVTIQGGFDAIYRENPSVFVAGDLLWYPVEGKPSLRQAPDVMIVFGRPKGERGSYQQWREEGIAPQIVWEVLSPGNSVAEMTRKFAFYERHGVDEYYVYDPDHGTLSGYLRNGAILEEIDDIDGWISPRTLVTLLIEKGELVLMGPDGATFASYLELERRRAEAALQAEQERLRADSAEARAAALAARLRELGVDPDAP
jgi:Uma2 family endonuclease